MENNEPPPPFPVDVLPSPFKEFVQEAAVSFPCPFEFVAVPLLTLVGAAIGLSRVVRIKPGWSETARLWTGIISPPGTMKTPSMSAAAQWLDRQEQKNRERYQQEYAEWIDNEKEGPQPICKRVYVTDTTTEALITVLEDNPRGVALYNDELSGWVQSIGQYKGKAASADRKTFLSIWSHQPLIVDRITRTGNYVHRPFLSITGGIQPRILDEINFTTGINDGFIDRILFCEPTIVRVRWSDATIPCHLLHRIGEIFDQLFRLPMVFDMGKETDKSIPLLFAADAGREFVRWLDEHFEEMESEKTPEYLRGQFAKMKGYVASFALILALMRQPRAKVIDLDSTLGAIALAQDYYKPHARRLYDRVFLRQKTDSGYKLVQCQNTIVLVLHKHGTSLFRELHQTVGGRYSADEMRAALQVLVNCQKIEEIPVKGQRGTLLMRYELSSRERTCQPEPQRNPATSTVK